MTPSLRRTRVAVFVGTRPEAIKLSPVILELRRRHLRFDATVVATSQHAEMAAEALAVFGLRADVVLPAPSSASLPSRTADLLAHTGRWLADAGQDIALVQGDTSTALGAALAAFYCGVPVGHVEAGLRTHHPQRPFPEEAHRRAIASVARWSFCPTVRARTHLTGEGYPDHQIIVTGNTVVDAVQWLSTRAPSVLPEPVQDLMTRYRTLLVTTHRREHADEELRSICRAMRQVVALDATVACLLPVHPNPRVRAMVTAELQDTPRIMLCSPQPYDVLAAMLSACALVVTDSGGLQEEAPSFGKRVVVCRTETERPEAVEEGLAVLAGTDEAAITSACLTLLAQPPLVSRTNPFGDGQAAVRICDVLEGHRPAW